MTPTIENVLLLCLVALTVTLTLGLGRAIRGPTLEDRLAAVLLLGTTGVAILLLLSVLLAMPAMLDVALVLALLAVVVTAALTRQEIADD